MTFYKLEEKDVIHTNVCANPAYNVSLNGNQLTGSIYLESQFLDGCLSTRTAFGFSEKKGGQTTVNYPITASIVFSTAVSGGTGDVTWKSINNLYNYYSFYNTNYNVLYGATTATSFRVISIPQIYYDNSILSGTFTASDYNSSGEYRYIRDDGLGGLYSGSLTGTLVGNIFYNEGIVVLKKPDLFDFSTVSSENMKWCVSFKGVHKIPVVLWRLRAPSGELNATTNPTYYNVPTAGYYKNIKVPLSSGLEPFITSVGLYDDQYNLIGVVRLTTPVKKLYDKELVVKCRLDF